MLWILREHFSQDWEGTMISVLEIDKEHLHFEKEDNLFRQEYGESAKGGYVLIEYTTEDGKDDALLLGCGDSAEAVYNKILDDIAWRGKDIVLDLRGYNIVGIV